MVGEGARADVVRAWLLQSGADPVGEGAEADGLVLTDAGASVSTGGPPRLDASTAPREEVAEFVRALAGRHRHTFDDHGTPQAWPRGSY